VLDLARLVLRYASKKDWSAVTAALKPVYTAPTIAAAEAQSDERRRKRRHVRREGGRVGVPPAR
jgi:transposase-like protein